MWIRSVDGEHVNLDRVTSFKAWPRDELTLTLQFVKQDGERDEIVIYKSAYRDLEEGVLRGQFMPSPPGYELLSYYTAEEAGQEEVTRWPVLGWMIDMECEFHQVVTAWSSFGEFDKNSAIACPNGKVIRPGDCCYDNEEAWLKDMRKEEKEAA